MFDFQLWNGVVTGTAERIATQYSFQCQPRTFNWPIFLDGLYGVLRAGGCVSACCRCERRDATLVETYRQ